MTRDEAYQAMQDAIDAALPDLEAYVKQARNVAGRRRLQVHIDRLRAALEAAKQA